MEWKKIWLDPIKFAFVVYALVSFLGIYVIREVIEGFCHTFAVVLSILALLLVYYTFICVHGMFLRDGGKVKIGTSQYGYTLPISIYSEATCLLRQLTE